MSYLKTVTEDQRDLIKVQLLDHLLEYVLATAEEDVESGFLNDSQEVVDRRATSILERLVDAANATLPHSQEEAKEMNDREDSTPLLVMRSH